MELLHLPAQSLIGSPGTLHITHVSMAISRIWDEIPTTILQSWFATIPSHSLHTYIQPTLLHTLHSTHLHTSLHQKPNPTNLHKPTHNLHTNLTNAPTPNIPTLHYIPTSPYMPTLPLQSYKPLQPYTVHCMPTLSLHTCSMSVQVDDAAAFCQWWDIMCCIIYWRNYCIWFWLICRENPEEGRGIEFLRKSAILADCITIIEHIKLPAKLLDYFLRSSESNISQSRGWRNFFWPTPRMKSAPRS